MISFKIYEKDQDELTELGTVLHESTLFRIAKHMGKKELNKLFVEAYRDGKPVEKGLKKGQISIAPLSTWE